MDMKKLSPMFIILAIVGGIYLINSRPQDGMEESAETMALPNEAPNPAAVSGMVEDPLPLNDSVNDVETLDDNGQMDRQEAIQVTGAQYQDYSPQNLTSAQAADKRVVMFFHADWCPTCRAAESDILENLDSLPNDLVILKTSFDDEKTLRQQYDVTIQHTFIQVDDEGASVSKWTGGSSETIVENLI